MDARILFLDLETTTTDPRAGRILEVAALLVDQELNEIARLGPYVLERPDVVDMLDTIDMHRASGLLAELQQENDDVYRRSLAVVENTILRALAGDHAIARGSLELAGYSIHYDRRWLMEHMPRLHAWLSRQMIDVSSIRQLSKRWRADIVPPAAPHASRHRAMVDCVDALTELRGYRAALWSMPATTSSGIAQRGSAA